MIDAERVFDAMEATWPAAETARLGPWTIRTGEGGGKRVSAATAEAPVTDADLEEAECAMAARGQPPLVMVRAGQAALDALLGEAGYRVVDPVVLYAGPAAGIAGAPIRSGKVFAIWEPLAIQRDLWAAGGIGPERLAVMAQAARPKTALLVRLGDAPAGTAYVAVAGGVAMIHAIEVPPAARRQGAGRLLMRAAAAWSLQHGAEKLGLAVTRANVPANALYASLGMDVMGNYHYRVK